MDPESLRAVVGSPAKEMYHGPGDLYNFLVTGEESGGAMFAFDCRVEPGGGPPPHRHLAEDEFFHLYEGSVTFTAGGETRTIVAGESLFVPKGLAHSYVNSNDGQASMITVYTPAGMEGWFREVFVVTHDASLIPPPPDEAMIARMLEAGPRYNVEWVDSA
jgi:quercetin dioxygenase-like cupin family protein